MNFKNWLFTEKAIPITQDMFKFASEVMQIVSQWNGPETFQMFKTFYQRDVDFGEYGRRFVQVRTAPAVGQATAKADGNLVTVFVTKWGYTAANEKVIAHELVHVIDPRLNMKGGNQQAYDDLYSVSRTAGDDQDRFISGYYNTRHEFLAYRSSDAYYFVDNLAKQGYDENRAKAAIQQHLQQIRGKFKQSWMQWIAQQFSQKPQTVADLQQKADIRTTQAGAKNYTDDAAAWQKYAQAYAQAFQDIYGAPKQKPVY